MIPKLGFGSNTLAEQGPRLDLFDNFPGFGRFSPFLKREIATHNLKEVADAGGGANPVIDSSFIFANGLRYTVLDISQSELDKAPDVYDKVRVDIGAPLEEFCACTGKERFDLVFSHMFLEHVKDPVRVHQNLAAALKPGGLAIHCFPSPRNLPMAINRLLPDRITHRLLRIAQPHRDLDGHDRKFPAFYAMCGGPSRALHVKFRRLGVDVVRHTGFIGHEYYHRIAVARHAEHAVRAILLKARIPMLSFCLLILRKRSSEDFTVSLPSSEFQRPTT